MEAGAPDHSGNKVRRVAWRKYYLSITTVKSVIRVSPFSMPIFLHLDSNTNYRIFFFVVVSGQENTDIGRMSDVPRTFERHETAG